MSNYEDLGAPTPKYRKRKVKRSPRKAKHKHIYIKKIAKIVRDDEFVSYYPVNICEKCGKVRWSNMFFFKPREEDESYYEMLTHLEDIQKYYSDLEVIEIPAEFLFKSTYI